MYLPREDNAAYAASSSVIGSASRFSSRELSGCASLRTMLARDFPSTALDRGLFLAIADLGVVLGRAQLAFDLHVVALLQARCVLGGLAEGDDAVPLGVVHPLASLLVLVAGLGGSATEP